MNQIKTIIGSNFPKEVMPLIENAKKSIDIFVYDWRNYPDDLASIVQRFNQSIVRSVRRGVVVRAIVGNSAILQFCSVVGIKAVNPDCEGLVHSKFIIFDEKDVVIGSHNFTQHAFTKNQEVSTYIPDYSDIDNLQKYFDNIYILKK